VTGLPDVSEGSSAIYTVTLGSASTAATEISLALGASGDTAEADDHGATLTVYYFEGDTRHELVVAGGKISLPAGVTTFFVSVPTTSDAVYEGAESRALTASVTGGASDSGVSTLVDDGSGTVYDERGLPTDLEGDDDRGLSADLDPTTDNGPSDTDRITSIIFPEFTLQAGNLLEAGQTVVLIGPDGSVVGTAQVTPEDVEAGTVNVAPGQLDDGTYVFTARLLDDQGQLVGESPVTVTVITDRDGVQPSVELAANSGDFNGDGISDWEQNNVAQLPLTSVADFLAGIAAPEASFGAIMAGTVSADNPGGSVQLDPTAQLLDISLSELPAPVPEGMNAVSPVFNFTVTSQDSAALQDMDATRAGLQTRVVIDLPVGVAADSYIKWDAASSSWFEFLDDGDLATFDDGATLLDLDSDGKIDRLVVTLTDGGVGDEDGLVNGTVVDPGVLVLKTPTAGPDASPVYSVLLANGDRFYTVDIGEAATMAQGGANVFEGARFDSLEVAQGGRQLLANYNPLTGDWYFAVDGDAMPYICYERMPGAGFQAAAAGQGPGADFHLFMNGSGITQLVTLAQAGTLGLSGQGFSDLGVIFNTTATSAFVFDAEGYLIANQSSLAVQTLVQSLAATYTRSSDAGFIEAVEQHYMAQVQLTGVAHGGAASAADLNDAFGTAFTG
ncbi:MAG TPA: choice-of-anchor U domain-containing protein, partial [Burkholderiaceae bacterium]|nr:choice-of-anchor U domain-containing protein [Burkholderiaceae bacterium]